MVPSYLRTVAGVCLLTTGLLVTGGGGVATASPDNSDGGTSAHQANGNGGKAANSRIGSRKPAPNSNNANTSSGPTGSVIAAGGGPAPVPSGVTPTGVSAHTAFGGKTSIGSIGGVTGKVPNVSGIPSDIAKATGTVANGIAEAARDVSSSVSTAVSAAAAAASTPLSVPSSATAVPAAADPLGLAGIVQPLGALAQDVAGALLSGAALQPFADVADQLLAGVSTVPTASGSVVKNQSVSFPTQSAAAPTSPQLALALPAVVVPGASAGPATAQARPEPTGVLTPQLLSNRVVAPAAQPPAVAPSVPPAANTWISNIASQIFHGVREALRNVSVTELAFAALPGIAGLMLFFATGIGLGRRQAKFGYVMATSGAVRFAVRGPMGVVRSGSTIKLYKKRPAPQHAASVYATGTDDPGGARRRHLRLVDPAA